MLVQNPTRTDAIDPDILVFMILGHPEEEAGLLQALLASEGPDVEIHVGVVVLVVRRCVLRGGLLVKTVEGKSTRIL